MTILTSALAISLAVMVWPARWRHRPSPAARHVVGDPPTGCGSAVGRRRPFKLGAAVAALGRRLRRGDEVDDVAEFVDLLALSLRSGLPPTEAIEVAMQDPATAHRDVRALARLLSAQTEPTGVAPPVTRAMGAAGPAHWSLLRAAWTLSLERGSPLTDAVETSAAALRARQASQRRALAARAGPLASMWLLTGLPVVGPLAALLVGVDPRTTFGQPLALASLLAGLGLTAGGWWWGSRIIRRAQAPPRWT